MRGHQANPTRFHPLLCHTPCYKKASHTFPFDLFLPDSSGAKPGQDHREAGMCVLGSAHDTAEDGHALRCGPASMLHPTVTESSLAS